MSKEIIQKQSPPRIREKITNYEHTTKDSKQSKTDSKKRIIKALQEIAQSRLSIIIISVKSIKQSIELLKLLIA